MGNCKSIIYYQEDEDDKRIREKSQQLTRDLKEFQDQLRKQRGQYSELDLTGKAIVSREQMIKASNIIYDA